MNRLNFELRHVFLKFNIDGKPDSTAFAVFCRMVALSSIEPSKIDDITVNFGEVLVNPRTLADRLGLVETNVKLALTKLIANNYLSLTVRGGHPIYRVLCLFEEEQNQMSEIFKKVEQLRFKRETELTQEENAFLNRYWLDYQKFIGNLDLCK